MSDFDPYHKWLAIPPREQPPHHYRLLGTVVFEDDADVIDTAAEQRMAYLRTCATGEFVALSQRLLNEVATARLCLLNPQKKAAYDAELRQRLAPAPVRAPLPTASPEPRTPSKPSAPPESSRRPDPLDEPDPLDDHDLLDDLEELPPSVRRAPRRPTREAAKRSRRPSPGGMPSRTLLLAGAGGLVGVFVLAVIVVAYVVGHRTGPADRERPDDPVVVIDIGGPPPISAGTKTSSPPPSGTSPGPGSRAPSTPNGTAPPQSTPQPPPRTAPVTTTGPGPLPAVEPFDAAQAKAHQQAWAKHLGESIETTNSIGMKLVVIPPGTFRMGSPPDEIGRGTDEDQVDVTLTRPFRMGIHEVTQAQWKAVVQTEPWKRAFGTMEAPDRPASGLGWQNAAEFCRLLTERERAAGRLSADLEYRLPTEAEWEFACRAGTTTAFWIGDAASDVEPCAWFGMRIAGGTDYTPQRVGSKRPNPWGLYDMHGNASEWVRDGYGPLRGGIDPLGPETSERRVYRGGWSSSPLASCRSACRNSSIGASMSHGRGFRIVLATVSKPAAATATPTTPAAPTTPAPPPTVVGGLPPLPVAPFDAAQAKALQEEWAKRLEQPVEAANSVGMQLVVIPPGTFTVGIGPKRVEVTLTRPYRIGRHEVTQGQWQDVMPPSSSKRVGSLALKGRDYPMFFVTHEAIADFCRRLTERERASGLLSAGEEYRLPTEAEWDRAAQAGTTTRFWFGDDAAPLSDHAWFKDNTPPEESYPHEVGLKLPNPWGLFDVHGNVAEWCSDTGILPTGGVDPHRTEPGSSHAHRGGNWALPGHMCSLTQRSGGSPDTRAVGFRVVRTIALP